ncbi:hypothetical protein N9C35_02250 [Flavobacteriaceae bacterium]|nr:hypothetical protein [Flavobacteriaceae bacterium]
MDDIGNYKNYRKRKAEIDNDNEIQKLNYRRSDVPKGSSGSKKEISEETQKIIRAIHHGKCIEQGMENIEVTAEQGSKIKNPNLIPNANAMQNY